MAGQLSSQMKIKKQEILELLKKSEYSQYVILIKAPSGTSMLQRYVFQGIYVRSSPNTNMQSQSGMMTLQKIYGKTTTQIPIKIEECQIDQYFKINLNSDKFTEIKTESQKRLGPNIDAVTLTTQFTSKVP